MKKNIFLLIFTLLLSVGCNRFQKQEILKVNIVRDSIENSKIKISLYSYDTRIAGKMATLVSEKELELLDKENQIEFLVPKDTEEDTYYIVLDKSDKSDNYSIDYSEGGIKKLKVDIVNEVKILMKDGKINKEIY
jgi:hypothetical protein